MTIFLIDDDDIFNYLHESVIKTVLPDAQITVFKSGVEFISYLEDWGNQFHSPNYIFLDIRMPDMDGFILLERLEFGYSSIFSTTRIYMISSTLDERDLQKARSFNLVTDFIGKPLTVELCESIFSK